MRPTWRIPFGSCRVKKNGCEAEGDARTESYREKTIIWHPSVEWKCLMMNHWETQPTRDPRQIFMS
jgi:hypothetical protein